MFENFLEGIWNVLYFLRLTIDMFSIQSLIVTVDDALYKMVWAIGCRPANMVLINSRGHVNSHLMKQRKPLSKHLPSLLVRPNIEKLF